MDDPGADEVVGLYLLAQVEALVRLGPAVRVDAPDAVHQMRVAARRLRSVIGSFQPLLERRRTASVRVGLRELGEALAPVRDSEVMLAYFAGVDPEPAVLLVRQSLREGHAIGRVRLLASFDDGRHETLVRSLTSLLDPPPFRPRAAAPAGPTLLPLLQEADARVELAATLALTADAASRDEHLHEVRKLSKAARYAAEAAAPALGEPARTLAAAMVLVQDALGRHQDSVQAIRLLRSVRDAPPAGRADAEPAAGRADADPAAFDRLIEVQRALGEAALADYDRLRDPISPGTG
jgi:CHAD domain-containing protein